MSAWCSGYHIRLTRERSPVQSRALINVPSCSPEIATQGAGARSPRVINLTELLSAFRRELDSVAEWSKASDSSSDGEIRVGSNPTAVIDALSAHLVPIQQESFELKMFFGCIAQW